MYRVFIICEVTWDMAITNADVALHCIIPGLNIKGKPYFILVSFFQHLDVITYISISLEKLFMDPIQLVQNGISYKPKT